MSTLKLGIIGGGQLGSLLSEAAKSLSIETVILTDDINAPAKNFTENFISGNYEDENLKNVIPIYPNGLSGNPLFSEISFHDLPPSEDL